MRTIEYVAKKVAEKNGLDEKIVERVIKHHWRKDIKHELVTMEHTSIYLRYIGTITYSPIRIKQQILSLIRRIRLVRETKKYTEQKRKEIIDIYTKRLQKLLYHRNILAVKYIERGHAIENKRILKASTIGSTESRTDNTGMD